MNKRTKLIEETVKNLDKKKAIDIKVLDVEGLTTLTDYFVIATGNSKIQVQALADNLEEELAKLGFKHIHKEGYDNAEWILLGYEEAVIHIFSKEAREFYDIEHIWNDAAEVDVSDLTAED